MWDQTRSDNAGGVGVTRRSTLLGGPGQRVLQQCGGGTSMPATVDGRPRPIATVHRVLRQVGVATLARIGIVAGTAIAAVLAVHAFGREYVFFDLKIYHGAVVWWASGGDLYQFVSPGTTLGFTYPPFAALVMAPMVVLSTAVAGWVNVAASLVVLTFILAVVTNPIADRPGWPRWF